ICGLLQEFRVEGVGGTLALEEGGNVLRGGESHAAARFHGSGAEVRGEDHVGTLKAGMDEGLLLEDVETGTGDFFRFESMDQSGFVDDRTPRSVDKKCGRLHAEEFGGVE